MEERELWCPACGLSGWADGEARDFTDAEDMAEAEALDGLRARMGRAYGGGAGSLPRQLPRGAPGALGTGRAWWRGSGNFACRIVHSPDHMASEKVVGPGSMHGSRPYVQ